jgi:excisionase family DNA binding protein
MKGVIIFPEELVDQISDRVIERLKPLIAEIIDNNTEDEFLTTDEASELLKVSKGQIHQWVSNSKHGLGSFPYKKLGKQLRFSKKELIKWMEIKAK